MNTPNPMATMVPNPPGGPSAGALMKAMRAAGVTHVVTVPDFVQFALHEALAQADSGITCVFACSEDQALTTATGLYVGGATVVVLVQNQGFYKCLNTLRATCMDAGVPVVFFVGQFGRETDNIDGDTRQSRRSMVRLMEPLCDTLGLRYWKVSDDAHVPALAEAFAHAKQAETGAVVLIDRHVTWN